MLLSTFFGYQQSFVTDCRIRIAYKFIYLLSHECNAHLFFFSFFGVGEKEGVVVIKIKIMMKIIGQKISTSQQMKLEIQKYFFELDARIKFETLRYLLTLSVVILPALIGIIFNDRR